MGKSCNRGARHRFCLVAVLVLVVTSLLRVLRLAAREVVSPPTGTSDGTFTGCDWTEGDPLMFILKHNAMHPSAEHWFHIAESVTGKRASYRGAIDGISANSTIYMQVENSKWMAELSPMGRLLVLAGLTSPASSTAHFVDADQASFLYPSSKEPKQSDGLTAASPGGRIRGVAHTDSDVLSNGHPAPGQVGVLSFDATRRGGEFVVDVDQSLPERLTASAHRPGDGRLSSPFGGVNGDESAVRHGEAAEKGGVSTTRVCVKYLGAVGNYGVKRKDWFPSRDDALSLQRAIDAYCPMSWLRDGCGEGAAGDEERRIGGTGRREVAEVDNGVGCGRRQRRLLLYQRDRNRKILRAEKILDKFRERLGSGWIVEKITHDPNRHPCELVDRLSTTDVLLTAHGFQSMLALFMPPDSLLFEVFPHKYFKAGYAPMAEGLGVRHAYSESPPCLPLTGFSWPSTEACMQKFLCRWYVRLANVELDDNSFDRLVSLALNEE